jgi:hypothetical protein
MICRPQMNADERRSKRPECAYAREELPEITAVDSARIREVLVSATKRGDTAVVASSYHFVISMELAEARTC